MSEHERDTAFLKQLVIYSDTKEGRALQEKMAEIERDERCVRRATWLAALVGALAMAGICYAVVFVVEYPMNTTRVMSQLLIKVFSAVGLASLVSVLAFHLLALTYRWEFDRRREECRRFTIKVVESRLTKPLPDSPTVALVA